MPIRPEKVAHAIKKEIAKLIQEELRDPHWFCYGDRRGGNERS